ncbi:MAG: radical SAM/SPASM domain-containing protein [Ferruginibacter sp.]
MGNILNSFIIFYNKISRIPKSEFFSRLLLGAKKYYANYPATIVLQTVSACNLQCKHCFITNYGIEITDGVTKIILFDEFKTLADRLKPMIRKSNFFVFSTFEAIINKDLFKMMDYLLEINPRLKFPFLSNSMQLTAEKIALLEKYPLNEINISVDGTTKDVVEGFKNGVEFDKILQALDRLSKSKLKDKVAVTFVAHKNNIHQLPELLNMVNKYNIKSVFVSNLLSFTKENRDMVLYTKEGNPAVEKIFEESIRIARKNKQVLELPLTKPKLKGCQAVESFFVNHNGNVSPCDFLAVTTPFTLFGETITNPPMVYGNVLFDDPMDIFRSNTATDFRKKHRLAKDIPAACTHCIDAYGLMCSNRTVYQ